MEKVALHTTACCGSWSYKNNQQLALLQGQSRSGGLRPLIVYCDNNYAVDISP